jgi:hypothetical protein
VLDASNESDRQEAEKVRQKRAQRGSKKPRSGPERDGAFIHGLGSIKKSPTENKITLLRSYSDLYVKVIGVQPPRLFNGHKPNATGSIILNVVRDFGLERTWKICHYVLTNWEEFSKVTGREGSLPTPDLIRHYSTRLDAFFQMGVDPLVKMQRTPAASSERASVDEWEDDDSDQEGW